VLASAIRRRAGASSFAETRTDTLRQLELRFKATGVVARGGRGDTTRPEHADDELRLNQ